jgi:hypothetical protein
VSSEKVLFLFGRDPLIEALLIGEPQLLTADTIVKRVAAMIAAKFLRRTKRRESPTARLDFSTRPLLSHVEFILTT